MSSSTPPQGEPDFLEFGSGSVRKPRRGLVVGIVAGVILALGLPLGAFAVLRLLSGGGTQPHDVLPADAVAYFRLDLDPSAPEKIDAIRFLQSFPAFERYTRIDDERVDLREVIVEEMANEASCDVDYQDDVAPWLGERVGVAVMAPSGSGSGRDSEPDVAVAIQVGDEEQARAGLEKLRSCDPGNSEVGGWSYLDGYMVVSKTERDAERFAAAAGRRSLADAETFREDMQRLGDPGVASAWLSGEDLTRMLGPVTLTDPGRALRSLAVAFRFEDRYAELATVVSGPGYREVEGGGTADMRIPETTAVALGFADGAEHVDRQWESMKEMAMGQAFGLRLPADIKTLVGDSFTLALDGESLDLRALMGSGRLSALDLGARVGTDADRFKEVVGTLEGMAATNGVPVDLVVEEADGGVVAATNRAYAARLAEGGSLADTDVFRTAVKDADEAEGVLFVSFDALEPRIVEQMRREGEDRESIENLTRLEAFGVSGVVRDGYTEGAVRLTVD